MANVKLGNDTLTGVNKVKLQDADNAGQYVEFAQKSNSPIYITLMHLADMASVIQTNYSITCNGTTKTREELRTYAQSVGSLFGGQNVEIGYLNGDDIYSLFGVDLSNNTYSFTITIINVGGDREFRYAEVGQSFTSFTQVSTHTTKSVSIGSYNGYDYDSLIILTNYFD